MTNTKLNSSAKAFVPMGFKSSSDNEKAPAAKEATKKEPSEPSKSKSTEPSPAVSQKKEQTPPTERAKPKERAPPVPVVVAWGNKTSNAVRAAPSARQVEQQQQQRPNTNTKGGDSKGGDKGQWRNKGGDRSSNGNSWRGGNNNNNNRPNNNRRQQSGGNRGGGRDRDENSNNNNDGWQRGKSLPLELCKPGDGETEAQKKVSRIRVEELLALRLSYVSPPLSWSKEEPDEDGRAPEACEWKSDTRLQEIDAFVKNPRQGGDVSQRKKKKNDTAPPLEDCKPLEVNEETRWKSKVFHGEGEKEEVEDSNKEVLKKSLLILNKLSLTKFEKLSNQFIASGIDRNQECMAGAIALIVTKAQDEPHFSAMYAALCLKLSQTPMSFDEGKKGKKFKKMLLEACQKEFEQDTDSKIAQAIEGIEDEEEQKYKAGIIKKHYLGHMTFIGELYKGDLISIKIMLFCLPILLQATSECETKVDEEKIECFAKLMTTIGSDLELQSESLKKTGKVQTSEELGKCWEQVEVMAGKRKGNTIEISNRIKFMLQDLIEMKEKGWVKRREEETAKTIQQIHKEAANEARRSSSSNNVSGIRRQSSANDVRSIARSGSKPNVDADGFTEVSKPGGFPRSQSMGYIPRRPSDQNLSGRKKPNANTKRSSSIGGSFAALNKAQPKPSSPKRDSQTSKSQANEKKENAPKIEYLEPSVCSDKAKNILKEFFVAGDKSDALLSMKELIGAGAEGSVDRGAKAVEGGIFLVLEMKQDDLEKFMTIIVGSYEDKQIEAASFAAALNDPLEFLSDIAIDAPLATSHMVHIVSEFLKMGAISFDIFLESPEFFRTDGNAAAFCCKVLKKLGGDAIESKTNIDIIEKLMTEDDKASFATAKDLLAA